MPFTRLQLQGRVFADLVKKADSDDETLTAVDVQGALLLGEQQFARDTRCFRRTASLSVVDEQAIYTLPEDVYKVIALTYGTDTSPLPEGDEFWYAKNVPTYRTAEASTPRTWWMHTAQSCRLYPPPAIDAATTMSLDGYCVPFAIGGSVTGATWSEGTATITTAYRHNLRTGDHVTISGITPSAYNLAATVTVASAMTFSIEIEEDPTAYVSGGYVAYTGGFLPMLADTDVSYLDYAYHLAIAHYATWWLSTNHLADDPIAQAAGQAALLKYQALVSQHEEERWL